MSDKSGTAFPIIAWQNPAGFSIPPIQPGLTKREVFAAMAMVGAISRRIEGETSDSIAGIAVRHADALLAALAPSSAKEGNDE